MRSSGFRVAFHILVLCVSNLKRNPSGQSHLIFESTNPFFKVYWTLSTLWIDNGCECVSIDVNQVSMVIGSPGGIPWLFHCFVENLHSSKLPEEAIKL